MTSSALTKRSLGRRLAAYVALLAITVQCFIVQPHVDPLALASVQATAQSSVALAQSITAVTDQTSHGAVCIICQAALAGGVGLADHAAATLVDVAGRSLSTPLPKRPIISATPSHAWQSRGPPTLV